MFLFHHLVSFTLLSLYIGSTFSLPITRQSHAGTQLEARFNDVEERQLLETNYLTKRSSTLSETDIVGDFDSDSTGDNDDDLIEKRVEEPGVNIVGDFDSDGDDDDDDLTDKRADDDTDQENLIKRDLLSSDDGLPKLVHTESEVDIAGEWGSSSAGDDDLFGKRGDGNSEQDHLIMRDLLNSDGIPKIENQEGEVDILGAWDSGSGGGSDLFSKRDVEDKRGQDANVDLDRRTLTNLLKEPDKDVDLIAFDTSTSSDDLDRRTLADLPKEINKGANLLAFDTSASTEDLDRRTLADLPKEIDKDADLFAFDVSNADDDLD